MPSSDSSVASSAATQITPGAMVRSTEGSGPTASGNRLTTSAKNTSGLSRSPGRRQARRHSRQNSNQMIRRISPPAPGPDNAPPGGDQGHGGWSGPPYRPPLHGPGYAAPAPP